MAETLVTGAIEDLREVTVFWESGSRTSRIFHKNDIAQFVEATVKLHFSPGFNPHSNLATTRVVKITASRLVYGGPYWWTSSSLNNDKDGARFIQGSCHEEVLFQDKLFWDEQIAIEMQNDH